MAKGLVPIFVAAATSLVVGSLGGASAIETVDSLDVTKYLGRWYQVKAMTSSCPGMLLCRFRSWWCMTCTCRVLSSSDVHWSLQTSA